MKKFAAILLAALLLAALPMSGLAAGFGSLLKNNKPTEAPALPEINFLGIPWLSSMEEVRDALVQTGLINESGVSRFNQVLRFPMGHGACLAIEEEEDERYYIIDRLDNRNLCEAMMMSSMLTGPLYGHELHNIQFTFLNNNGVTQLVDVNVSFMPSSGWEDVSGLVAAEYGEGQKNGDYGTFWAGSDGIGLLLDFGSLNFGRLDVTELLAQIGD